MSYTAFSTGLRSMLGNATGFKTAFTNGVLYFYPGPMPASPDAAVVVSPLVKITLASGAFAFGTGTNGLNFTTQSNGTVPKATGEVWSGVGLVAGICAWGRFHGNPSDDFGASTTLARIDFDIATAGAAYTMANLLTAVGSPVLVESFSVVMPGS